MRILIRHPGVGKLAREVQLSVEPIDNLLDDGDRSRREVVILIQVIREHLTGNMRPGPQVLDGHQ